MQANPNSDSKVTIEVGSQRERPGDDAGPPPERGWAILGIHGEAVTSVDEIVGYDENAQPVTKPRNVARVRFFIDGEAIDEDVDLPVLSLPGVTMTTELYEHLMSDTLAARRLELAHGAAPRPDPQVPEPHVGEVVS